MLSWIHCSLLQKCFCSLDFYLTFFSLDCDETIERILVTVIHLQIGFNSLTQQLDTHSHLDSTVIDMTYDWIQDILIASLWCVTLWKLSWNMAYLPSCLFLGKFWISSMVRLDESSQLCFFNLFCWAFLSMLYDSAHSLKAEVKHMSDLLLWGSFLPGALNSCLLW